MKVPSTEVQNNFGKYMKIAAELEDVIVTRKGKGIIMMVPYSERNIIAEEAVDYIYNKNKMSYEEFLELTEKSDLRYEYIDGEVYCMASPSYNHQTIVKEILVNFHNWFKGKKCTPVVSPFDVTLIKGKDNFNVVQPDLVVICDREKVGADGKYKGTPTLAVEVLSNSTKKRDMLKKLDLYMQTGISEYWLVDPEKKSIFIYGFENQNIKDHEVYIGNTTAKSAIFQGLEISLQDVFTE